MLQCKSSCIFFKCPSLEFVKLLLYLHWYRMLFCMVTLYVVSFKCLSVIAEFPKAPALLIIRLFSVVSRTLVEEDLPLCRNAVGVFCSTSRLGHFQCSSCAFSSAVILLVRYITWWPSCDIIAATICLFASLVSVNSLFRSKFYFTKFFFNLFFIYFWVPFQDFKGKSLSLCPGKL